MAVTYYAILTAVGAAKLANAAALGTTLQITQMAVGDGGGNVPVPDANRTTLVNEVRRAPLNQLKIDPNNPSQIIAEQVIPESVGGWWIREIGLLDNTGALIAIANCAPSYKPQLAEGSGRTQTVRMVLIVNNTGAVELKIDPSVVLATREYVDTAIVTAINRQDAKASVRAATTASIALNGLPTVDGVVLVAGDRVLVKNQAAGSQNGIYVAAAGAWARSADADENAEVTPSLTVSVESGTTLADTVWQLITDAPIVVGTTALVFQDITNGLARLASPAFSGNPTAPTPAQFDADTSIATTEFVQRAMGSRNGYVSYTASQALTVAHVGGYVRFNLAAAGNCTLPAPSSVPAGSSIIVQQAASSSGALTISPATGTIGGPGVNGAGGITALVLQAGSVAQIEFVSDGISSWVACNGSYGASFAANGYQKLPSGLILQWGCNFTASNAWQTITFPVAFPNTCFAITTGCEDFDAVPTSRASPMVSRPSDSKTQFKLYTYNLSNQINPFEVSWLAIGN